MATISKNTCIRRKTMIVAAAVKFHITKTNDEVILCGCRHGNIFKQLQQLGFAPKQGYTEIEQGFINEKKPVLKPK